MIAKQIFTKYLQEKCPTMFMTIWVKETKQLPFVLKEISYI